jgi:hypothetical protein
MSERPSLGWSSLVKSEFSRSAWDSWKRIAFLLAGAIVIAIVFYSLTREVQMSTAHATGPSGLHYDPNAP